MGALTMAIFGLATVPALFIIGMLSSFISQMSWRKHILTLASIIIAIYGIYTGFKGVMMIKNPEMIKSKMSHMKNELRQKADSMQ